MSYTTMIAFISEVTHDFPIDMPSFQTRYPDEASLKVVYEFIKYLHANKRLCKETVDTAINLEAANIHKALVERAALEGQAPKTLSLLKWCLAGEETADDSVRYPFIYANTKVYIHLVPLILHHMKNQTNIVFHSLGRGLDALYANDLLSIECVNLLITDKGKYQEKVQGLKILKNHNNLHLCIQSSDYNFKTYCSHHTRLLGWLRNNNYLTENIVQAIFKVRKNKTPLYYNHIKFITDWLAVWKQRYPQNPYITNIQINEFYIAALLNIDVTVKSLPSLIKALVPTLILPEEKWQELENYSTSLIGSNKIKCEVKKNLMDNYVDILRYLYSHNLDDIDTHTTIIHYLIHAMILPAKDYDQFLAYGIISTYGEERLIIHLFLNSNKIRNNSKKFKSLFWRFHERENKKTLLLNPLIIDFFLDNEVTANQTIDIFNVLLVFQNKNPTLITDEMIQSLKEIDNFNAINFLISLPYLGNNLAEHIVNILRYHQYFLKADGQIPALFNDIPNHFFGQQICQGIFQICENNREDLTLERKRSLILFLIRENYNRAIARVRLQQQQTQPQHVRLLNINRNQNTHTESVHVSTDITIWLMTLTINANDPTPSHSFEFKNKINRYKNSTDLTDKQKQSIRGFCDLLSNKSTLSLTKEKKQRCLALMQKKDLFNTVAEIGNLHNALIASLDETISMPMDKFIYKLYFHIMLTKTSDISDDDVFDAFLRAAYEVVRGDNLDAQGNDNTTMPNLGICTSGSFNKFCEILSPFSPLIIHYHVSNETVMQRIKIELINSMKESMTKTFELGNTDNVKNFIADIKHTDKATDVYSDMFANHEASILAIIKHEYSDFISQEKLTETLAKFKQNVLPYLPSPMDEGANLIVTDGFIKWLNQFEQTANKRVRESQQNLSFFSGEEHKENLDEDDEEPQHKMQRLT